MSLSNDHIATNEIPLLEQLTDLQKRRLHLFVILLKQYIYACKWFEKKPIEQEFQTKVTLQWKLENMLFPEPQSICNYIFSISVLKVVDTIK